MLDGLPAPKSQPSHDCLFLYSLIPVKSPKYVSEHPHGRWQRKRIKRQGIGRGLIKCRPVDKSFPRSKFGNEGPVP